MPPALPYCWLTSTVHVGVVEVDELDVARVRPGDDLDRDEVAARGSGS